MNQQHTTADIFRHSSNLLQQGDLDGWLVLCDDDVVFEFPFAPEGRPSRVEGKAALAEYVKGGAKRLASPKVERMKIHVTEDPQVIVVEMTVRGFTGRMRDAIAVVTVQNRLITEYRDYWNPLDLAPSGSALGEGV